ncbi:MerR family transcriptional regulator [Amycolatopsis thermoflava]|uniref:MerR family transcriptional regulator n=1 Tax=Amycolatopsis thermoflava TaxID=84480 RepID=UPI0012FC532A|nr:MerR family transcriptional regulator [Amycolatopsis thermoflava]
MADLDKLDAQDYPAFTTGRAAKLPGVQEVFLCNPGTAGLVHPERSQGGHRRYSRGQLAQAARLREQRDQGHTLAHPPAARPAGRRRGRLRPRTVGPAVRLMPAAMTGPASEAMVREVEHVVQALHRARNEALAQLRVAHDLLTETLPLVHGMRAPGAVSDVSAHVPRELSEPENIPAQTGIRSSRCMSRPHRSNRHKQLDIRRKVLNDEPDDHRRSE